MITQTGTLVDALPPGSMVGHGDIAYRVLDTTMRALADAAPLDVLASGSGSTGTTAIGGGDTRPEAKSRSFSRSNCHQARMALARPRTV